MSEGHRRKPGSEGRPWSDPNSDPLADVLDAFTESRNPPVRHTHFTRDIKPHGECPACDLYWDRHASPE